MLQKLKFLLGLSILFSWGCDVNPGDMTVPNWKIDLLGPIATAKMNVQDILQIKDVSQTIAISASNLSIPTGVSAPIPAINTPFGPFSVDWSNAFETVSLDSGRVYFTITNNMPINIKSGTIIQLKQTSSTIFSHTLTSDITANGGTFTLNPKIDLAGQTIENQVSLNFANLKSDGSSTPVTFNNSNGISIKFTLDVVKINNLVIKNNNFYTVEDTSDFDISSDVVKSSLESGKMKVFFVNRMPLSYQFQGYLLDSTKSNIIDSLFLGNPIISAGKFNSSGVATDTTHSIFELALDSLKINKMYSSKYLKTKFSFISVPVPQITISKTDSISSQVVADVKLKIN